MTFLKVVVFSVAVLLLFDGFTNLLPQIQSNPPEEEVIDTASLDMPGMIALGENLFKGKGTCTLCHNDMGRAPNLLAMDLATEFPARINDPRYNGVAKGETGPKAVEDYIRESMLHPSAYVVAGFGKKGTNDTESPMPTVDKPPVGLNPVEINAIIAFLEDRADIVPTVPLPKAGDAVVPTATGEGDTGEAIATTGEDAISKFGCAACHDLLGSGADVGPPLNTLKGRMTKGQVMEAILEPNNTIAKGYDADIMPQDFGEQMQASELLLIVDYLLNLSK